MSEMASLAKDTIIVSFEMPASFSFVLLVDLILAMLTHLLWVEVLLLLELICVLRLTHAVAHLAHLLLLLHHLHLIWHHTWLHLHLHVMSWHPRHIVVHLIRCVHLSIYLIMITIDMILFA